jgi:uncharacterized membrane protein
MVPGRTVCRSAKVRVREIQCDHAEHEQPDLVAFLLPGQSISVEVAGYAIRYLLHMTAGGWGGMACTLLAHQSLIQTLVSIESTPSCSYMLWKTLSARQNLTGPYFLNKKRTSTQNVRKCHPARPQRVMARGVPSGARGATNKEHQVCARRRVVRRPGLR